jgi:flavin-dependent thymidylate synthase
MDVSLISYTPDARELLLYTKHTRLQAEGVTIKDIKAWPEEKKQKELGYMLGTIQSSWEFVDYVFSIRGVSRGFTHQFVRSRTWSFAQESQRVVDKADFEFIFPEGISDQHKADMSNFVLKDIKEEYHFLAQSHSPQVARSVLPTNVATAIIGKGNLRGLSGMAQVRLCTRTQGEYQDVFRLMRKEVLKVHPWAEPFIRVYCASVGVCCFPKYAECPIKPGIFDPDSGGIWQDGGKPGIQEPGKLPLTKQEIQARWESTRYEADPTRR